MRILAMCAASIVGISGQVYAQRADTAALPGGPIVVSAKTASGDGVAHLPAIDGATSFTVTATNKGDSRSITIMAQTAQYPLPVDLAFCQTGPLGHCPAKPAATKTIYMAHGAVATFKVTVKGTDNLPRMDIDKVALNFYDNLGNKVGGTAVALADGSRVSALPTNGGIYTVEFNTPAHPGYDLSGQGLMIATGGYAFILTQSGIVLEQAFFNFKKNNFYTSGLLYPIPNTRQGAASNSFADILVAAVGLTNHWITGGYQLTGGRVPGFEYGTVFASYQKPLYERRSSLARVTGTWKIRTVAGGPVLGSITFDASGYTFGPKFRECNTNAADSTPLDGTIAPIDTRFNVYAVKFKNGVILTDDPICDDLSNASGLAATFDGAAPNDTLRILIKGQNDAYSWILTRQ